ncbi:hypothetical protein CVT23_21090, partial [Minwuia thermotolerans]
MLRERQRNVGEPEYDHQNPAPHGRRQADAPGPGRQPGEGRVRDRRAPHRRASPPSGQCPDPFETADPPDRRQHRP